jgi:rubrerythrin
MVDHARDAADEALNRRVERNAAAAIHCLAAAERAVEEGRFNLAKILRAFAHSARLQALAAARRVARDRSPVEALARAPDGVEEIVRRSLGSLEHNRDVLETDVAQSLWGCQACGSIVEGSAPASCADCGALAFEFDWFGPFYSSTYERLGRRTPAEIQQIVGDSPRRLGELLVECDEERLARRPSTDEWSIKEIAGHLTDVTGVFCSRVRTVLKASTPSPFVETLPPWKILEAKDYRTVPSQRILDEFGIATGEALALMARLDPAEWGKYGFVRARAATIMDLGTWLANHNIGHLAQIAALRECP